MRAPHDNFVPCLLYRIVRFVCFIKDHISAPCSTIRFARSRLKHFSLPSTFLTGQACAALAVPTKWSCAYIASQLFPKNRRLAQSCPRQYDASRCTTLIFALTMTSPDDTHHDAGRKDGLFGAPGLRGRKCRARWSVPLSHFLLRAVLLPVHVHVRGICIGV